VQEIYAAGEVTLAPERLAMNFLQDRDAAGWTRDLAGLKAAVGALVDAAPLVADGALSGDFTWRCAHGRISGRLALAATQPPTLQKLTLAAITP
jgi:hypothetical protein